MLLCAMYKYIRKMNSWKWIQQTKGVRILNFDILK